jgi:apolipoprotein D and lipocalin family protein
MNPLQIPSPKPRRALRWLWAGPVLFGSFLLALVGCRSHPPLPTVPSVDLQRFTGDWYVVAHIPAGSEANAHNAVESYRREADGGIATSYAFRDGGFDGPLRVMRPNAVVTDAATNATWGMQFFWPLRFEYLITYLDADYQKTIIGRSARDYAWIMARTPSLTEAEHVELTAELARQGYDTSKLRRVPHRWPDADHPRDAGNMFVEAR